MSRILITGGPKTGKTTLALSMALKSRGGGRVRSTDSLIATMDWSAASAEVSTWLDDPGPWIIEGVAVPRALRKWLASHPDPANKPADQIIVMATARRPLSPGQVAMGKGVDTVWREVEPQLVARGVLVELCT